MPDPPKWVIAWTKGGGLDGPWPAQRGAELKRLIKKHCITAFYKEQSYYKLES